MPRVAFAPENKIQRGGATFDKLKLSEGESVRIIAGLEEPVVEFVHELRKPKVEEGSFVFETKNRRDGSTYEVNATDFQGIFRCKGDTEVLTNQGIDPDNCSVCKESEKDAKKFPAPKPKYALNVFRYQTKKGSTEVAKPFGGQIVQWILTPNRFGTVSEIAVEHDIKRVDLVLGPCDDGFYQRYDIKAGAKGVWLEDDANKKYVIEAFKENKREDIADAIAPDKEQRFIDMDVRAVLEAWAAGSGTDKSKPETDTDLDDDLAALAADDDVATDDLSVDDLLGSDAEEEKTEEKSKSKAEKADIEDDDLDDLLADLA